MNLARINIALGIVLLVVVLLTTVSRVDYTQPNIEILPDMKYTPAWMAYRENTVFANGRTLQTPVPGTIARGQLPLHFQATKEDAERAGNELTNPYHGPGMDPAQRNDSVLRGGAAYRIFCVCCHGATGVGDGPVAKRGFPPPPSLLTGNSLKMKDGQLFHILTYGQGSMSGFAGQLSRQRRWDLINYLRNVQQSNGTPDQAQETAPADEESSLHEEAPLDTGQQDPNTNSS